MRLVALALTGLTVLLLAGACGETSVVGGTSLTVEPSQSPPSGPDAVYSFALAPKGGPSGVVALRAVLAGEVDTLVEVPFRNLEKSGSAIVHVTPRRIDVTCDLPGQTALVQGAEVKLPKSWRVESTAWSGCTLGPAGVDGERAIWVHTLQPGTAEATTVGGDSLGTLTDAVSSSRERPDLVTYCLTIALEAP